MNPPPNCARCNSNTQVRVNQLSNKLTCHRIGCLAEVSETDYIHLPYKVTMDTQGTDPVPIHVYKRKKPSLLARLFSRIGQKRRGWGKKQHD
jgi:hypothetical protein